MKLSTQLSHKTMSKTPATQGHAKSVKDPSTSRAKSKYKTRTTQGHIKGDKDTEYSTDIFAMHKSL